jgi:N6-adenosine-specific RNA methylase IME4
LEVGQREYVCKSLFTKSRVVYISVKKYAIIYADPPWRFKNYSDAASSRWAGSHYPLMSAEDIQRLPVGNIADRDCALFMWATFPTLPQALAVIAAWGFVYKTVAFTWVKRNRRSDSLFWGTGYWTRSNAEICLLATKGKPKRVSAGVHSVLMDRVSRHSAKPDDTRKRIVELVGDLPRVELFARQKTKGWDAWGNEVKRDIELIV